MDVALSIYTFDESGLVFGKSCRLRCSRPLPHETLIQLLMLLEHTSSLKGSLPGASENSPQRIESKGRVFLLSLPC